MTKIMTNHERGNLIRAVRDGDVDKASALIAAFGISCSDPSSDGYSLLCTALKRKHTQIARIILAHDSTINRKTRRLMDTPLHIAVENNDAEIIALLLDRNMNVNAKNLRGETPLHLSIKENNLGIVSLLLNKNSNVNAANSLGETPLCRAIVKDNVEIVELFWRNNARTRARSSKERDALHMAADFGITKILEHLLNRGAFVDIVYEKNGYTPLYCASAKGKEEIVKLLLQRGADINARTKNQSTALHLAAAETNDKIVKLLLEHNGVDVNAEDDKGKTVLNIAIEQGHLPIINNILDICPQVINDKNRHYIRDSLYRLDNKRCGWTIVRTLLSHGFRVHPEDASDSKLLLIAVERGLKKIVADLLRYGADVHSRYAQKDGYTLLHNVAINNRFDIAKMLIKYGANVNAIDETGKSPIIYAIKSIDVKMTKLLVSSGAAIKFNPSVLRCGVNSDIKEIIEIMLNHDINYDIMAKDKRGETALYHVVSSTFRLDSENNEDQHRIERDLAELLLSRGAKVDTKDGSKESLLHMAVACERDDIVQILLRYNADVNILADNMQTPLHYSTVMRNVQISRMLLNAGAAPNAMDEMGYTALHHACCYNDKNIVDMLLEFGADIEHKNSEDSTPLHIAAVQGSPQAVEALLESFAEVECTDKDGKTALHGASKTGWWEIAKELLDYGADPNVITCKQCHSPIGYTTRGLYRYNKDRAERDFHIKYHECVYDIDDRFRSRSFKPSDTIKQHIIKIKALNIHDSKRNSAFVELNDEFKDFWTECESEVGLMKSEKIGETNISYHGVLMKSINQLAMLARNKDIVEVLESFGYREKFPIYYKMLHYKFKKGQKRENLLNSSLRSFNVLSGFLLPELVSLKLLGELSNKELEILIKAGPETESR